MPVNFHGQSRHPRLYQDENFHPSSRCQPRTHSLVGIVVFFFRGILPAHRGLYHLSVAWAHTIRTLLPRFVFLLLSPFRQGYRRPQNTVSDSNHQSNHRSLPAFIIFYLAPLQREILLRHRPTQCRRTSHLVVPRSISFPLSSLALRRGCQAVDGTYRAYGLGFPKLHS